MVGQTLIDRVRVFLRDTATPTAQGEFWRDEEILLILNVAQDVLVNFALKANRNFLNGLISDTGYQDFTGTTLTLPADYLHYMSGMVGDADDELRLARFYLGGEGYAYFDTLHDGVIIFNNDIHYIKNGVETGGLLNYYKRPEVIIAGAFDDSFLPEIYENIIARHAAVILGIKETTNQRDFKNLSQNVLNIRFRTDDFHRYIINNDTGIKAR